MVLGCFDKDLAQLPRKVADHWGILCGNSATLLDRLGEKSDEVPQEVANYLSRLQPLFTLVGYSAGDKTISTSQAEKILDARTRVIDEYLAQIKENAAQCKHPPWGDEGRYSDDELQKYAATCKRYLSEMIEARKIPCPSQRFRIHELATFARRFQWHCLSAAEKAPKDSDD